MITSDLHAKTYGFFADLAKKIHPRDYTWDYRNGQPVPMISFDNFLPQDLFSAISQDVKHIPDHLFTEFTRNGSHMLECKNWCYTPLLLTLVNCFNGREFIDWLESLTGQTKIIPDPHFIGAGISISHSGSCLKLHTDFNWNDELALNRCLSLILYINPEWHDDWGGNLEFYDFDYTKKLQSISPASNRLIIWDYHERLLHGYPEAIRSPDHAPRIALRIFYYKSNATPTTPPHRSLYWWDEDTKQPFDRRT